MSPLTQWVLESSILAILPLAGFIQGWITAKSTFFKAYWGVLVGSMAASPILVGLLFIIPPDIEHWFFLAFIILYFMISVWLVKQGRRLRITD